MSSRARRIVPVLAVLVVALGATAWWWRSRGAAPPPPAELPPVQLRLEATSGPRAARVLVDGTDIGSLARDEQGHFSGTAQLKLTSLSRSYRRRKVEIRRDPDVDVELAAFVQRLLAFGGARQCVIIEPE